MIWLILATLWSLVWASAAIGDIYHGYLQHGPYQCGSMAMRYKVAWVAMVFIVMLGPWTFIADSLIEVW